MPTSTLASVSVSVAPLASRSRVLAILQTRATPSRPKHSLRLIFYPELHLQFAQTNLATINLGPTIILSQVKQWKRSRNFLNYVHIEEAVLGNRCLSYFLRLFHIFSLNNSPEGSAQSVPTLRKRIILTPSKDYDLEDPELKINE